MSGVMHSEKVTKEFHNKSVNIVIVLDRKLSVLSGKRSKQKIGTKKALIGIDQGCRTCSCNSIGYSKT